ncbi:MAG TPA: WD40 repeat domain-containing serine/threonine-protein kinase [Leptolyngbyaceae cyanobacterium]
MSYCLNPDCQKRQNPDGAKFCLDCGSKLLLKERYRTIRQIGQGGFGRTFLAIDEDKPSKPCCVIKQFFPKAQGTNSVSKAAKLFEQEAVRLDELGKHPQIPDLLAHFTQDKRQYLVQEFIDGENLAQILKREGSFREHQIWQLLNSLLPVLDFIHSHNVIHRDIKPANIIRAINGQLVLVDFGAAKYVTGSALLKTGTTIGTPEYIAPEQAKGRGVFASDLYSLGVTCIHLLTQVSPFDLFDTSEDRWVWRQCLVDNPVSDELACIIDKLIIGATKKRYQSALEVLKECNPNYAPLPIVPVSKISNTNQSLTNVNSSQSIITSTTVTISATSDTLIYTWKDVYSLTGHLSSVSTVAISPNGKIIASGGFDNTIKLWNLQTGELICSIMSHSKPVLAVAFNPDGKLLVSGSVANSIKLWDLSTQSLIRAFTGHSESVVSLSVDISPDGQMIASGSDDQKVKIWQLSDGKLLHTFKDSRGFNAVTFSPDGKMIAVGSSDNSVKLWNLVSGELVNNFTGHTRDVNAIAFSPNGKILASGSSDHTIKIWHLSSGKLIRTIYGHSDWVRTVAFNPCEPILISGSEDKTIKLWQVNTGELLHTLQGHSKDVNAVDISKDGKTIVSGSSDKTIKIWRFA